MRFFTVSIVPLAIMASSLFSGSDETLSAVIVPVTVQTDDISKENGNATQGVSVWVIDNSHTSVVCAASHFGLSYIYGRFNRCAGTVELDLQKPDSAKFRFEIDPNSIDTNDTDRDAGLRGVDGFDVATYETITFESISVKTKDAEQFDGNVKRTFLVTGNLMMHGETRKIDIPLELLAMGTGVDGKIRCGFIAKFFVRRGDFGLNAMADSVGDSVSVTFCFQAVRKEPVLDSNTDTDTEEPIGKAEQPKNATTDAVESPNTKNDDKNKRNELEDLFRKTPTESDKNNGSR